MDTDKSKKGKGKGKAKAMAKKVHAHPSNRTEDEGRPVYSMPADPDDDLQSHLSLYMTVRPPTPPDFGDHVDEDDESADSDLEAAILASKSNHGQSTRRIKERSGPSLSSVRSQ